MRRPISQRCRRAYAVTNSTPVEAIRNWQVGAASRIDSHSGSMPSLWQALFYYFLMGGDARSMNESRLAADLSTKEIELIRFFNLVLDKKLCSDTNSNMVIEREVKQAPIL